MKDQSAMLGVNKSEYQQVESTEVGSSLVKSKEKDNFPSFKEFLGKSRNVVGHRSTRSSFVEGNNFRSGMYTSRYRTNSGCVDTPTGDMSNVRMSMPVIKTQYYNQNK